MKGIYLMLNDSKSGFVLYKNYYDILKDLPDAEMGILFRAVLKYQATGEISELPATLVLAFGFIKNQFDLDENKYNEFVKKQSVNGKKGGRPKLEKNPKNPSLFLKTQKSLKEKDKEKEKDKDKDKDKENLSLNQEREKNQIEYEEIVNEQDKKTLENYVRRKKLATRDINAYVRKIITNGDHIKILEQEKEREREKKKIEKLSSKDRVAEEVASIYDKKSAFKVLARYYNALEEFPPPLMEIAEKYNLSNSNEICAYDQELRLEKLNSASRPP